jgi:hypothetical protein
MAARTHTLIKAVASSGGRCTLMQKKPRQRIYHDLRGPLFGNRDRGEFYRAVAAYLAELAAQGVLFTYRDRVR